MRHPSPLLVRCVLVGAVLTLATRASHADVRILGSGGPSFPVLQDAVDAAADGDTLLLGGQVHEGCVIDGKGLTLVALPGVSTEVLGCVDVRNLAAASTVRLDGLVLRGLSYDDVVQFTNEPAVRLEGNLGAVQLYGCELSGGSGPVNEYNEFGYSDGANALVAIDSVQVTLAGCELLGGNGAGVVGTFDTEGGAGGDALRAEGSALALYDSSFTGGRGGQAGTYGGDGGDGASLQGLGLFASGCHFEGGNGGPADDFLFPTGGDGGNGLWVALGANARLLDNDYLAGAGGVTPFGSDGADGAPNFWEGGVLSETPGVRRSLRVAESLVFDGEDFQLTVEGEPGDRVFLAKGLVPRFDFSTTPPGVRLVNWPSYLDWWQSVLIGPSGVANLPLASLEQLPGGWRSFTAQAVVLKASGGRAIGGAVFLTSLDDEGELDCNANGIADLVEIAQGLEADCDGDFVPDSCPATIDCDGNGIQDTIDIECNGAPDVNGNSVPDACEFGQTLHVDAAAAPGGDGSVAAPFTNLSQALTLALDGWSVRLAPGLYTGPQNRDLAIDGRSLDIACLGGSSVCTLDLQSSGPAFADFQPAPGSVLRIAGITFLNGFKPFDGGGALRLAAEETVLEDCVFVGCVSGSWGGAVNTFEGLTLRDCVFEDNIASGGAGGAIFARSIEASRTRFARNSARAGGAVSCGGIGLSSTFAHCEFVENTASGLALLITAGGALFCVDGDLQVDDCLFAGNSAQEGGGAIWFGRNPSGFPSAQPSTLALTSSTLVGNDGGAGGASSGGGACYLASTATLIARNSVLWGNTAVAGPSLVVEGIGSWTPLADFAYCDLDGGAAGVQLVGNGALQLGPGVIDLDPLFVAPLAGDYRLGAGSPCVDAGSDAQLASDVLDVDGDGDVLEVVPLDLALQAREVDDPSAADSGVGTAPLTDLGAFERQGP